MSSNNFPHHENYSTVGSPAVLWVLSRIVPLIKLSITCSRSIFHAL
jgi:hypothetical protein